MLLEKVTTIEMLHKLENLYLNHIRNAYKEIGIVTGFNKGEILKYGIESLLVKSGINISPEQNNPGIIIITQTSQDNI